MEWSCFFFVRFCRWLLMEWGCTFMTVCGCSTHPAHVIATAQHFMVFDAGCRTLSSDGTAVVVRWKTVSWNVQFSFSSFTQSSCYLNEFSACKWSFGSFPLPWSSLRPQKVCRAKEVHLSQLLNPNYRWGRLLGAVKQTLSVNKPPKQRFFLEPELLRMLLQVEGANPLKPNCVKVEDVTVVFFCIFLLLQLLP